MKVETSQRKLILGGGTLVGAVIFLAIIVAIQYIILQHPTRWDLTGTGKYTLSPQSKKVLGSFQKEKVPIEVMAFYESKNLRGREQTKDLFDQYRDVYPEFTYTFIDPDRDRAIAVANKVEAYPTVLIKARGKNERLSTADEETITNALVKLLRDDVKKVYLLKGHGELSPASSEPLGFKVAKEQIEKQNYKTSEVVLMQTSTVPKDATLLIIAGPKTDPLDSEFEQIREYLAQGGSLMVLLTPFKTPKLCAFLKEYGFQTADDIVVDRMSKAFGGDYLMPLITTYVDFPITKNFELASFFPEARSVGVPEKPGPGLEAQELALTSPVSWTISKAQLDSGNANFDPAVDKKGPISVMAVATHYDPESAMDLAKKSQDKKGPKDSGSEKSDKSEGDDSAKKIKKARIVVFGSSLFASDKYFKVQGNGDLFMNTVSWLAEEENLIAIRPKSLRAQPIVLTPSEHAASLLVPVVIIPLAWVIAGVIVFLYRRRSVVA